MYLAQSTYRLYHDAIPVQERQMSTGVGSRAQGWGLRHRSRSSYMLRQQRLPAALKTLVPGLLLLFQEHMLRETGTGIGGGGVRTPSFRKPWSSDWSCLCRSFLTLFKVLTFPSSWLLQLSLQFHRCLALCAPGHQPERWVCYFQVPRMASGSSKRVHKGPGHTAN